MRVALEVTKCIEIVFWPFGFVGRGGARERAELSPKGEAEQSGLCDDAFHVKHQGRRLSWIRKKTRWTFWTRS